MRYLAFTLTILLLIGCSDKEHKADEVKNLGELKTTEIEQYTYKEVINTEDLKLIYVKNVLVTEVDTDTVALTFNIENYQNYPLKVQLENFKLKGYEDLVVNSYGEAQGATQGEKSLGYFTIFISKTSGKNLTGELTTASFTLSFESEYKEFWKKYTVELDL